MENFDIQQFEDSSRQNGVRYWIAHEFMGVLGYKSWTSFQKVINRAMASCASLNVQIPEVFIPAVVSHDGNEVNTYRLTRFACFLVTMHADSKKPQVAQAKTALAAIADTLVEQEIQRDAIDRLDVRNELKGGESSMSAPVEKGRTLYDFMGKAELAANLFRTSQTAERIKSTGVTGLNQLSSTASEVGQEVRSIMLKSSGVAPESLPIIAKFSLNGDGVHR